MATSKKLSLGSAAKISPQVETKPATVLPDQTGTVGPAAPPLPVSAVPGGHWASNTALKIGDDDDFAEDMSKAVIAGETFKRKVFTILFRLREIFTDEERATFPHLLPKLKDQTPAQSNIFIAEYKTTKKNKDGKEVVGTGNRYDDLAYDLPWIKAWAEHKDYLVAAKKDPTKRRPEHATWSGYRFDTEIGMYARRVKDAIVMLKDAVRVEFQAAEINTFPQIGCELITHMVNGEKVLVDNPDALAIWSKTERDPVTKLEMSTSMSSAAFLALKPGKVADEKGGKANVTLADMLASAGRVTGTGAGTTEPVIKSLDTLEGTLAETAAYLNQDSVQAAIRAKLAGKDKKGNPLMSDGYILSIYDAHMQLDVIATMPEFAQRAKALVLARAQAGMAKMQADAATKAA